MTMKKMIKPSYLNRFLKLKCSGDIINILAPISGAEKEITESWAILRKIKPLVLADPNKYSIVDYCAGNALTSVMAAFILPITKAVSVDIKLRDRNWSSIKKFKYIQGDIYAPEGSVFEDGWSDVIMVSSHPCKHAIRVIDIFNMSNAKALCLIPCCHDSYSLPMQRFLRERMDNYDCWSYYLGSLIKNAKVTIQTDSNIKSPKNNVIYAQR